MTKKPVNRRTGEPVNWEAVVVATEVIRALGQHYLVAGRGPTPGPPPGDPTPARCQRLASLVAGGQQHLAAWISNLVDREQKANPSG